MKLPESSSFRWPLMLLALIIAAGVWLRIPTSDDGKISGFDEGIYSRYVTALTDNGLLAFPALCAEYRKVQPTRDAFLPPTRILFLTSATYWSWITGWPPREAVRAISCAASCLILLLTAIWTWRVVPGVQSIGVTALVACAPTQIHMAHRALIDGFFAFWALLALWALWEALQKPGHRGWLALYAAGLAALVLTKENAFFVYVAICGILLINLRLRFGTASRALYAVTVIAPVAAALVLILAGGGLASLIEVYRLNVEKSHVLPYAIMTGDGPWFRYLLDLLLVSPVILLIAVASLGTWSGNTTFKTYLTCFVALSYILMAQVKYGMNLRYGNMWDLPLRVLVMGQLFIWCSRMPERYRSGAIAIAVVFIAAAELGQYNKLFEEGAIYDPVPSATTNALEIIKRR